MKISSYAAYSWLIYFGNQNNFGINPAGRYLSTYAQDIKDRCTYNVQNGEATSGQEFDTGKSFSQEVSLCDNADFSRFL